MLERVKPYWPLFAVAAGGLVLRFWLVLGVRPACDGTNFEAGAGFPAAASLEPPRCLKLYGDSLFIYMQGKMVAAGKGYGNGFAYLDSAKVVPSAGKPPLLTTYLAVLNMVGLHSVNQQRLGTSVLGALGIVLLGLLAWRLAGKRAGLLAAVIAALSPLLWVNDGRIASEAVYVPLIAGVLLAVYSMWSKPRWQVAAVLGVLLGLGSLTRAETSMLFALLLVPLFLSMPKLAFKTRVVLFGVAAMSGVLVISPWVVRNLTTFKEPTFLSFGTGSALLNGQCEAAYYTDSDSYGLENFKCLTSPEAAPYILQLIRPQSLDESQVDAALRKQALDFLSKNESRVPMMLVYREGRVWELYKPIDNIDKNYRFEDRGYPESVLGLLAFVLTMPLAIYGVVLLRKRKIPISPFGVLVVLVAVTVAGTFGIVRFRISVDAAAVVLAAIAVDALLTKFGRNGSEPSGAMAYAPPRPWFGLRSTSAAGEAGRDGPDSSAAAVVATRSSPALPSPSPPPSGRSGDGLFP